MNEDKTKYIEELERERDELAQRKRSLEASFATKEFKKLDKAEKLDQRKQRACMNGYLRHLDMRLQRALRGLENGVAGNHE
jgi:hypothetical protein